MALFKKLQAIYGLKWDEQFRTAALHDLAIAEWGFGLYGLTGEQIATGIARCRTESEWPPSIAGFLKLAKGPEKSWEHAGPAYQPHVRALPKPRLPIEVVRDHFCTIRQALRG